MRLQNESAREALAAEYVLGTLRGPARQRFEKMLSVDTDLQGRVGFWEASLQPLADQIPAQQPPRKIWAAIQARLGFVEDKNPEPLSTPDMPAISWLRGVWVSLAVVVLLTTVLVYGPLEKTVPFTADIEVALTNKQAKPVWVVDADSGRNKVIVKTVRNVVVPDKKSLELWLVLASGESPVSLGLMPTGRGDEYEVTSTVPLDEGIGFAVSLEPEGGSPTGVATGPILYIQTYRES